MLSKTGLRLDFGVCCWGRIDRWTAATNLLLTLQDKVLAGALGPEWAEDTTTTFSSFLWSSGFPSLIWEMVFPWRPEMVFILGERTRKRQPIICPADPRNFHIGIQLGWEMHMYHQEGHWVTPNMDTSRIIGQRQSRRLSVYKQSKHPCYIQLTLSSLCALPHILRLWSSS